MGTILVATVGGSPEPIINAIRQNTGIEFVYFLCSTGPKEASSDRTIEEDTDGPRERHECGSCGKITTRSRKTLSIVGQTDLKRGTYAIERVSNPDELSDVLDACSRIEELIKKGAGSQLPRVVANYSGGTKTMAAGLVLHAATIANPGWEMQINSGSRRDLVSVKAGDVCVLQNVREGARLAKAALTEARKLAARADYKSAIDTLTFVLSSVQLDRESKDSLQAFRARCELHAARARFDHQEALEIAKSHAELETEFTKVLKTLLRCKTLLEGTDTWSPRDEAGYQLVSEMLQLASSCALSGRFDDAAARLYRATELLAQVRLRRSYGLATGSIDVNYPKIPEESRADLEKRRDSNGKVKIELRRAYELLDEMKDPLGAYFRNKKESLLRFLEVRNNSLLAHGLRPVDEATWKDVGVRWRTWVEEALAECK